MRHAWALGRSLLSGSMLIARSWVAQPEAEEPVRQALPAVHCHNKRLGRGHDCSWQASQEIQLSAM